jgi:hypothetical protein
MDLIEIQQRVSVEIDNYIYEYPPSMVGDPWPAEKVEALLRSFRSALIDPYWVDALLPSAANQRVTRCAIVAGHGDDYLVAFDPTTNEFFLAVRTDNGVTSIGVYGDAVGCWMAR